jgi:hypothetical protein
MDRRYAPPMVATAAPRECPVKMTLYDGFAAIALLIAAITVGWRSDQALLNPSWT